MKGENFTSLRIKLQVHAPQMRHRSFLTRLAIVAAFRDFNLQLRDLQVAKVRPRCDNNSDVNFVNRGIVGGAAIVLQHVLCLTSTQLKLCLREKRGVWSLPMVRPFIPFRTFGAFDPPSSSSLSPFPSFYYPRISFARVSFGT